jgi:large subunit ribosomal protein L13
MKTIYVKQKDIERKWYIVDAAGKTLGRMVTKVVKILRGKHKPYFVPNQEVGDYVVIINAEKSVVTGKKRSDKLYYRYSGHPGGLRSEPYEKIIKRKPTYPTEHAIKGMLPKGPLGRQLFRNVKIYAGPNHPHAAQQPEKLEI